MQDSSGVHVWLVLMKAFQALMPHAQESIKRTELGDSDFQASSKRSFIKDRSR